MMILKENYLVSDVQNTSRYFYLKISISDLSWEIRMPGHVHGYSQKCLASNELM
jgi:hypothetical protein